MQYLKLNPDKNILLNPSSKQLNIIGTKDPVIGLMTNKTSLLIKLYKKNKDPKYLKSSIETALITDTILTQTRHEQSGEQSKLYWRNYTRSFFTDAMEACFIANDVKHAFYFMERSRAVLLNDKLNELGASSHLSDSDAKTEQDFKINIAIQQEKLNDMAVNATTYNEQQSRLFGIKDNFEHFTKSLEKKYPAYYQYKYEDGVPSLVDLQKYIAERNECFIHYFTNDTVAYILTITLNNAKIKKLSKNDFNFQQINRFLIFCSKKDSLNKFYQSFATLSNSLYKTLFQPLQIPKGRVVICSDNFLLPFEALCSDKAGKNFLIDDYIFSYAYSATYLLRDNKPSKAKGNFIGFAPVSFQTDPGMGNLINSAVALTQSSEYYGSTLLFTNKAATKNNFIQNIGNYTVANIFSHASGNNNDNDEPRLYMQDSLIQLSDLQFLDHPATRLVVLSACQTNVGKNVTGEGIYSLARGFASAGIPAIAATLWNADEDMIYEISTKFHECLSRGM
ncbi:MAG: CHAT domain-containing protein, partial [Bacteroidia bacterium]